LLEDAALVVHVAADGVDDTRHEIAPQLHLDVDRGEGVVDGVAPCDQPVVEPDAGTQNDEGDDDDPDQPHVSHAKPKLTAILNRP
jgi:hypothetical protein